MVLLLALGGTAYVGCSRAPKKEAASKLGTANDGFPKSLTELNEWYVEPPAGQNAADFFSQGFDRLQIANAASSNLPLLGKGNLPPMWAALPASLKSTVAAFLRSNRDALQLFDQGRQFDQSRYPVNLALGFDAVFPHLAKARGAEKLLALSALMHADANEGKQAADDVLAALALAHSFAAEPMVLSQSIRAACVAIAVAALEQTLNRVSLPKDSLTELLKLLQKMEDGDARGEGFSRGLAGERTTWMATLQAPPKLLAALSSPGVEIPADQRDSVVARLQKGDQSKDEQKFFEKTFHELMTARHETFPARLKADSLVRQRASEAKGKKLTVLGVLLPGFAGPTAKEAETLAQLRLAVTAVALERFSAANDNHFPAALSELAPDYFSVPPVDPFDGQPLRYRKQASGYLLYSIGPVLKDNGGERTN